MAAQKAWAVMALSAVLVYAIRYLGMAFGSRLPQTGGVKRALDALPGTIFAALVFPSLVETGLPGVGVAAAIFFTVRKTGSVFLAMIVGMGIVALVRLVPGM